MEDGVLGMLPRSPGFEGYHRGMLIARMRPSASGLSTAATQEYEPTDLSSGAAALHWHEAHALLLGVSPLAPGSRARALPSARRGLAALAAMGAERRGEQHAAGSLIVELHPAADVDAVHKALAGDPHVEWVARVPARCLVANPAESPSRSTPPPMADVWNLQRIHLAEATRRVGFKDAEGVRVGVIDTGAQQDHPGLAGCVDHYVYDHQDAGRTAPHDILGHGTHVSGVLGARREHQAGACGVCRCDLTVWKVYRDDALYTKSVNKFLYPLDPVMYRRALAEFAKDGVAVLNVSLGGVEPPDPAERELYEHLVQGGTAVVAAMGNDRANGSRTSYPAALPGVIAVGALDRSDGVWSGSSSGTHIALSAPGVDIWSTVPTYPGQLMFDATTGPKGPTEGKPYSRPTGYVAWPGTSVAAPQVSAAAALLVAKEGTIKGDAIRERLMRTADRLPCMRGAAFDPDVGAGCLNLERLLAS
jgi:subtilisin family serine protease